jgi:pimeloyl-ACP methyl ester carboxylesterase
MTSILFLPGGGGAAAFWHPLGQLLPAHWRTTYLSWPGLGNEPPQDGIHGFDDLVALAAQHLPTPSVVVAQSMGCVVGMRLALEYPRQVTHLVLAAASGGFDIARFDAENWRPAYRQAYPHGARWITEDRTDLGDAIARITCQTLLLWGDADPISPVAAGRYLNAAIDGSTLHVVAGGDHAFARERAAAIAPLVQGHIAGIGR